MPPASQPERSASRPPRRLLVGCLPDPRGDDALALADVLCELLDARPTILRVVQMPPYMLGDEPERALERETREELAAAGERLAAHDPATRAICDPSAAGGLYEQAEADRPVAIVVGSTHRGKLGRVLAGSTARALLQGAPAAVAVAPLGYADREEPVRRVGVAFDDSEEARTALAAGCELARAAGAELVLLTGDEASAFGYGPTIEILTAGEIESAASERAGEILETGAGLVPGDIPVHPHRMRGEVGPALERESDRLDLLVVGSRGYGPLRRTLLGSVSAHLVDHARCPVLVTPRVAGEGAFGEPAAPA